MAGELYFALLLFTPVVIAITAADLALGGLRDLQSSSPFRTAEIVILVAYACLGVMLLVPLLLLGFPAMLIVLLVAYLALGTAQATAIAAGLEERWGGRWPARLVALLLAYLPMLGSAAAAWGAAVGSSWGIGTGLIRFFAPLAAIAAPSLVLVAYPILRA
jgi:hypothetical protein